MPQDVKTGWRSCFRNDLLSGKVALVTGGGTGIGRAIATELACVGATVIISSRNVSQCEETAKLINDFFLEEQSKLNCGATGKVYAGPSTSIRSEEEIEILVCYYNYIFNKYFSSMIFLTTSMNFSCLKKTVCFG